jgi:steroid delta-isomerase-like uncharacterized protein
MGGPFLRNSMGWDMKTEETAKKWLEAFNSHDSEAFADLFAWDAVVHDPFSPEPLKGKDAIRKNTEDAFKAFPDMRFRLANMLIVLDKFAADGVISGTHQGPLIGPSGLVPPTNRAFIVKFAAFVRTSPHGLIVELQRYTDTMGLMAQLGLMPGT